jgi:hypothetical protein
MILNIKFYLFFLSISCKSTQFGDDDEEEKEELKRVN